MSGVTYRQGRHASSSSRPSVVLLAGYTYENVRLLLLSKSKAFPNGLSNNHGQVGRHYFSHNQGAARERALSAQSEQLVRAAGAGRCRGRLGRRQLRSRAASTSSAAAICGSTRTGGRLRAANMSTFGRAPRWGAAWKAFISENADRGNTAYLQQTTLPYEDNYLDLDPDGEGSARLPGVPHHGRLQGERAEARRLHPGQDGAVVSRRRRDCDRAQTPVGTMGPTTHAYGGTRMGDNPETNVVDRWGFSHEVPNLGVLGASVMGTSGARNPTLTAQALAWRTAEHLANNWKSIAN